MKLLVILFFNKTLRPKEHHLHKTVIKRFADMKKKPRDLVG